MGKILKVNKLDIDSIKKLYEFLSISNPNWQENRKMMIKMGFKNPVKNEEELSGFALFYETIESKPFGIDGQYLFVEEDNPVVSLKVDYFPNANCVDISYVTRKDQMNRGYATAALNEISEYVFKNSNVEYIRLTIISMSSPYSKKVALNNGFIEITPNEYRKNNPNYQNNL